MTDSQDKLSDEQLTFLAEFAGGTRQCEPPHDTELWYFPDNSQEIYRADWNPLLPAHGWLILKAYVEKVGVVGLLQVIKNLRTIDEFWEIVCEAALGTRKDGG